jgi:hypothetical protein
MLLVPTEEFLADLFIIYLRTRQEFALHRTNVRVTRKYGTEVKVKESSKRLCRSSEESLCKIGKSPKPNICTSLIVPDRKVFTLIIFLFLSNPSVRSPPPLPPIQKNCKIYSPKFSGNFEPDFKTVFFFRHS